MAVGVVHFHFRIHIVIGIVEEIIAGNGDLHTDAAQMVTHLPVIGHGQRTLAGGNGMGILHHIRMHAIVFDAVLVHPLLHHGAQLVGIVGVAVIQGLTQAEDIAFVGDLAHDEHRIVLVAKAGVGIVMGPELGGKFLLQLDHPTVDHGEGLGGIAQGLGIGHAVSALEAAVGHHIHVAVDALLLQRMDQIVQPIHAGFIQHTGGGHTLALGVGIEIGRVPFCIQLMEADDVTAGLRQAASHLVGIAMLGKIGASVEIHTPKTGNGAVLKNKSLPIHMAEAMLAGRLFTFKYEGNIHGHRIGIGGHRNVFRHTVHLFVLNGG